MYRFLNLAKINIHGFSRLAKEGSWIIIGQITSVIGALVLVRVLTDHLLPSQYGQLALGLTVAGLINQVLMGGLNNGISRFYTIAAEKGCISDYLCASFKLMLYATMILVIISLVFIIGLLWLDYTPWIGFAFVALVFSVITSYNATLSGIQNAARQRAVVAFHGSLDAWLKILLVLGLILWLGNSPTAVVIGYALSSLLVTCSQLIFLRRLNPMRTGTRAHSSLWVRQIWSFSWPFSAWGIFTWAQQSSDRWALEAFTNTHEVGLYSVLFQLGFTPIAMMTGLMVAFVGPIVFQQAGDATDAVRSSTVHRYVWSITFISLSVTLLGFIFTLVLHRWIFSLLVGADYQPVSYLLPWLVLAGGMFAAGQIISLKQLSDMKPKALMPVKIVTALLGVILNVYFASVAGLVGIVIALVAFSAIYFVWLVILTFRKPLLFEIN